MKKWKARVLGGKLSADQAESFIAEYEKLSASLPTGKRNFLKASFNKMEQAAKAGDKGKLGAIATEVKDYLARNSAEVKEDYQTRERDRQIANLGKPVPAIDAKEKASNKVYGKNGVVAHKSLADMLKKANKKASVKEEQEEYIAMLESALESIAEELELDPNELVEAVRSTVDREGNHTPGLIRKAIGALGGKRISPKNARTSAMWSKISREDKDRDAHIASEKEKAKPDRNAEHQLKLSRDKAERQKRMDSYAKGRGNPSTDNERTSQKDLANGQAF
jgi:hypothetical protein